MAGGLRVSTFSFNFSSCSLVRVLRSGPGAAVRSGGAGSLGTGPGPGSGPGALRSRVLVRRAVRSSAPGPGPGQFVTGSGLGSPRTVRPAIKSLRLSVATIFSEKKRGRG